MKIIQTKTLTQEHKQSLFELWNSEYPEKIGYKELSEFENYLEEVSIIKHYLLVDNEQLQGWAFTFKREGEDWFGIIINSKIQRKRFGTVLLDQLKKKNSILNGWVIDHQNDVKRNNKEPYLSPLSFYIKSGFTVNKNIRMENDKISAVKIRWERT